MYRNFRFNLNVYIYITLYYYHSNLVYSDSKIMEKDLLKEHNFFWYYNWKIIATFVPVKKSIKTYGNTPYSSLNKLLVYHQFDHRNLNPLILIFYICVVPFKIKNQCWIIFKIQMNKLNVHTLSTFLLLFPKYPLNQVALNVDSYQLYLLNHDHSDP